MIDNTINDDKTIAGGGKGVVLAGRYHILRQLGEGGMGSVWLAEDRQLDNRKVAIKMLPTIVVKDKWAYHQLKSEALVSLKLVHPNIVTLRAFEENNGAPFLVMDYIEGQTLSDYLAVKGKLSEQETVALLKPIAAALDYAHGEKVIHRDVKPSNIIIRKDGHPFILDFGIAREIQESMTRITGKTISGTLLYMSPEQLRGAPPTPAQDVYSFAAMAYECLKGEPPFIRGDIARQIIYEKPITLVGRTHLVIPVMAGLAKRPANRPKSCGAVLGCDSLMLSHKLSNVRFLKNLMTNLSSKGLKFLLLTLGVPVAVVIVALTWQRIQEHNKKHNTEQFLALVEEEKYDAASHLEDKIDVSDGKVQFALGRMYFNGNGVAKNRETGIMWFHKAAEQGNIDAQAFLGAKYIQGSDGFVKNTVVGMKWIHKAAKQGDALAQMMLGLTYAYGMDGIPEDKTKAIYWLRKSVESERGESGVYDAKVYGVLGGLLFQEGPCQDIEESMIWTRKAAEKGDATSQERLGLSYLLGDGVKKDYEMAVTWLDRAARRGRPKAQSALGICYKSGMGVEQNDELAFYFIRESAEQGLAASQFQLGNMYEDGIGVAKDEVAANEWYIKAAKNGEKEAQEKLRQKGVAW